MGMRGIWEFLDGKIWEWDLSFRWEWEWEWDGNGNEVIEMGGICYENLFPHISSANMNFLRQGIRELSSYRQTPPKLYTTPFHGWSKMGKI